MTILASLKAILLSVQDYSFQKKLNKKLFFFKKILQIEVSATPGSRFWQI